MYRGIDGIWCEGGGHKTTWKLFVVYKMTQNITVNKDAWRGNHISRCQTPCRSKANWNKSSAVAEMGDRLATTETVIDWVGFNVPLNTL